MKSNTISLCQDNLTIEMDPGTPWTRSKSPASKTSLAPTGATAKRGRKRRGDEDQPSEPTPAKSTKAIAKGRSTQKFKLHYTDFLLNEIGDRVLSCGEGDQLGHPGRTTTKKPRKIDVVEEEGLKIIQVVAGGVHSAILTAEGEVFACGINEKGTVPAQGVEPEGSTDEFTCIIFSDEIKEQGKIIMLTAGASFTAALTDKGSVIAWGNLRDSSGEIDVHPLLTKMQEQPVIIIHYKKRTIVKIAAGENHLVMLSDEGKVLTFGDGSMGQLGRSTRISHIRPQYMVDESGNSLVVAITEPKGRKSVVINDIHAAGFWTMVKSTDDRIFAFGLNNFGHLGIPLEEAETGSDGKDTRELRVSLPTLAPAFSGHKFTHMDGVQHVIARTSNSELYAIGKNTDNALGLGTWTGNNDQEHWKYETLEKVIVDCGESRIAGSTAKLGCSITWTDDGEAYSWGCDTSGQLGLGIKDDDEKVVGKPQKIGSAHLEGYKIISVSIADNHSLFLAKKV